MTLATAIRNFGNIMDVAGENLGVDSATMTRFDAVISQLEGASENENPMITAAAFALGASAVVAIGPEALAAGVGAALGADSAAALAGTAALIDEMIATSAPGLFTVTSGSSIVASTSTAVGAILTEDTVSSYSTRVFSWVADLFSSPNVITLTPVSGPVTVGGSNVAIFSQDADIISSGAVQVSVIGNASSIAVQGNGGGSGAGFNSVTYGTDKTVADYYDAMGNFSERDTVYSDDTGQLKAVAQSKSDGSASVDVYNPDNGVVAQRTTISADGSVMREYYDPNTGTWLYTGKFKNGNLVDQSNAANVTVAQFAGIVADSLAGQVISQFILKNNLPASLAAQAFAHASIDGLINASNGQPLNAETFSSKFAASLTGMAGAILGSDAGEALFNSLGLPTQLGSLTGSVLGQALTQQLTSFIANEAFNIDLGLGESILSGTLSTGEFIDSLGASLETAGFALAGSTLEQALFNNRIGPGASIGGAIGSAIGAYVGGPIGAFIGDFLGSLFGGLFGGHPSVGPGAVGHLAFNGAQFYMSAAEEDNDGDLQIAKDLINAEIVSNNAILNAIGGEVVAGSAPENSLGYIGGHYFFSFGRVAPQLYYTAFADAGAAIDYAVLQEMRSLKIQGGNPYMQFALGRSVATSVAGLVADLNAAHDYSIYASNPQGFDVALAATGNLAQLQTWVTESAMAISLGLDRLSFTGEAMTVRTSAASLAGDLAALANMAGQSYKLAFTDTTANLAASISLLQSAVSSGHLASITVSGAGLPTLALTFANTGGVLQLPDGTAVGTIIGSALNYGGAKGPNVVTRSNNGQVTIWTPNTAGNGFTRQALDSTYVVAANVTAVGAGKNFSGNGGYNLFLRNANGQVTVWEFDANGNAIFGQSLDPAFVLGTNVTIIGAGSNFFGLGGRNVFIREAGGQVTVWELDANGHGLCGQTLDATFVLGTSVTVIGAGANFFGMGGRDVFIREPGGQVTVWELDASGHALCGQTLVSAYVLGTNVTVIGAGANFGRTGGRDLFVREPGGQVTVWEFDASGHGTFGQTLDAAFVLGNNARIIGAGVNYSGQGGRDVFIREPGGQVTIWEFDANGHGLFGQTLDATFVLGSNVRVIGAGANFSGSGGRDVFIREAGGQVTVWEFDANGHGLFGQTLDAAFVLGSNVRVIGAGANYTGNGGRDVFIREAGGQVTVWEFDSAGHGTFGQTLDANFVLGNTASVIGGGTNFNASGGHDVFIREASGQVTVWEFDNSGHGLFGQTLSAFTIGTNSTVVGSGQNFFANGSHDLFIRSSTGQLTAYEFIAGSLATSAALNRTDGTAFVVASSVFMSGTTIDPITGKTDIILQTNDGQRTTYALSGTQLAPVAVAGTSGNDTLIAVNGVRSVQGGAGNDLIVANGALPASTIIDGGTGTNTLQASGDISKATVTNIQLLQSIGPVILTVAQLQSFTSGVAGNFSIVDTAANVSTNLALLQTFAATGQLTAVTLTDTGTPTLSLNPLQVTNNAAAINKIVTPYQEAFPGSPVLTNVGGALKMSDGTVLGTVIGSARNYAGTNGPNIITRGTSGRVTVWALDGGGHPVFGQTLDPAYVLGTNVTVIGAGTNFAGKGGYNLFIREAAGQVTAWEFDSNGHGLYGKTLDSAYVLSTNVTIIGAGANFSGNGGRNVFIREAAGQVTVWEFDSTGHGIFGQTLDSGFTLGTNVSVIGGGMNFNSSGGHDVFIREAGGQVTVWEFNAAGHGTYGQTLNASFTVGTNVAVIGAGQNLFANGGHDLFIRNSTGQLTAYEFVSGNLTSSAALKNTDGSNFLINGGVFMSGTIIDPVTSKTDIILQSANGQKTTYGLSSQQLTALSVLGTSGNDVLVASSGTETLTGNGGYDAYQFGAVFGQDTVANNGGGTPKGEIDFSSAASNQLWFKHTGNDLEIDLVGTTKKITVAGWYGSNAGAQVQSVNASDGLKLDTQLAQLVAAMAAYSANHAGFNPATATQMPADSALQSALAASWHH